MKFLGAAAALLMLWSLSYLTLNQIKIWTNRFTLWDSVIEQYPETVSLAYYNRGTAFRDEGRLEKALEDYDKAIALNPEDAVPYYQLAQAYGALGNAAEQQKALAEFRRIRSQKASRQEAVKNVFAPQEVTKQELDPKSAP